MAPSNVRAWLRQTSSIHGIAALAGTGAAATAHFVAHVSIAESATIAGTVAGIVCLLMGDNTGNSSSVERLVFDAATGAAERRLNQMIPTIAADIRDVLVTGLTQTAVPVVQVPRGAGAGETGNVAALVVPSAGVERHD